MRIFQMAYKSTIEGGEVVLLRLVRSLKSIGATVHVCAPSSGELLDILQKEGFETVVIEANHLYSFRGMKQLRDYWKKHKIDIVQTHGKMPNIVARMAKGNMSVPRLVSTEHCILQLAYGGNSSVLKDQLKSVFYRKVDCFTSRYSDKIVCVSNSVFHDKVEQGIDKNKLQVIPNGVDFSRFVLPGSPRYEELRTHYRNKWNIPLKGPVIGSVCRLDSNKNVSALIKMMPFIWDVLPEARLVIIGDGEERASLQSIIDSLESPEKIVMAGYCRNVPELLTTFDIGAFASSSEGFGLAIVEVMASAVPVVTTAIPAVTDFGPCGDGVQVVDQATSANLAKACICFLSDDLKREAASDAAVDYVHRNFSCERMVEETVELYKDLGFLL